MNKNALLVFVKNMVSGKVKTRLAATIGNEKALEIYKQLVEHTCNIVMNIDAAKIIFYADEPEEKDVWQHNVFKQVQHGKDLGERMMHAFDFAFEKGYQNVLIIGTDCAQLDKKIIDEAFDKLYEHDIVIGPAFDGGYYLLGMRTLHKNLFIDIEWSTQHVLSTTIKHCNQDHLTYFLLQELHDVDEEKDLVHLNHVQ